MSLDDLYDAALTAFFAPDVIQNTIAKLVNNSTPYLSDALVDVVCACLQSPLTINVGDRGIHLFRTKHDIAITFKQLSTAQLRAILALLQYAYEHDKYHINRSQGNAYVISFPVSRLSRPTSHVDILLAVYSLIQRSCKRTPQAYKVLSSDRIADIILHRVRNIVFISPDSLRDFQKHIQATHERSS